ncbi:MAG: DinB family protein [Thermomicrobiales bacterium]|nr:DinB family protein [Thermomicrobiales bacterium]
MNPYNDAVLATLEKLLNQVIETMEGMPEDALATWKTSQAHGDISTMYGMATHIAGAGEFWTLQAVGGRDLNRQRLAEFEASGSIASIRARYDAWLAELAALFANLTDDDLRSIYRREANPAQGVSRAEMPKAQGIIHALDHTAQHLGHMQVQRQLWDQEQAS